MLKVIFPAVFFLLASCQSFVARKPAAVDRPPQFVLLAFDGSKSLPMWQETRDFARVNKIKFTYFISGVYFIPSNHPEFYAEPRRGLGKSAIGWGNSGAEVNARYKHVAAAISEGHEVASHANGHFDGGSYSPMEWSMELRQFRDIAKNGWELVGRERPAPWWESYFNSSMVGFRAPQLGHNAATLQALADNGYKYDTSKSKQMSYWPQKVNGVWNFPLAGLRISRTGQKTLSMDYNFYVADSNAKKGPSASWPLYEERMVETYMSYFNNNYYGNRAPIDIGHHFSRWNGGAYWKAMQRFAKEVCHKPEVRCATYSDLLTFVEKQGASNIANYQEGNFRKINRLSQKTNSGVRKPASTPMRELSSRDLRRLIRDLPPIPHDEDEVNQP